MPFRWYIDSVMRLPFLVRRENNAAAQRERTDQVEKAVTESLRKLAKLVTQTADLIEKRRLERKGYEAPETFLQRAPKKDEKP